MMSEQELTEQLDQAIEALLRKRGAASLTENMELGRLLSVAAELIMLPREKFKTDLRTEIEKEISMNTAVEAAASVEKSTTANAVREGFRTVTPYLTVPDIYSEIEFLTKVFGAEGQVYGL